MPLHLQWILAVAALAGSLAAGPAARPANGSAALDKKHYGRPVNVSSDPPTKIPATFATLTPRGGPDANGPPTYDDDVMLGDMPTSMDNAHATARPDEIEAEKESTESMLTEDRYVNSTKPNKKLRLKNIKIQILSYMGRSPSPSPTIKTNPNASTVPIEEKNVLRRLYENLNIPPSYPFDTQKTQSFYPNCGLPKNANEELWYGKDSMNLIFNITAPKTSSNNIVNITTATLRLYKQLLPCTSQATSNETAEDCFPTSSSEETSKQSSTNLPSSVELPTMMEDKQIRVSIYAYIRTLKKKKMVRRKLLDSNMVPFYSEKWTEWNIRNAVKIWRQDPLRNFGLSVEVEDEDGNILPVNRFFKPLNCTSNIIQMSTPRPIPGFLIDHGYGLSAAANATVNVSSLSAAEAIFSNAYRYPMVDVTTIEMPSSEVSKDALAGYPRHAVEKNAAVQQGAGDDQRPEHRIRHNNRHRANGTAANPGGSRPPMDLSEEEKEFQDRIIVLQRHPPPKQSAQQYDTDDDDQE